MPALTQPRRIRGFTMIEAMVVVAVIGILSALAYDSLRRSRPRATFEGAAAELQSLIHGARAQALADGLPVAVLVFPDWTQVQQQGRIIVYEDTGDPNTSLFSATAALNFDNYDPDVLASTAPGSVITTLELPGGVLVGPATGLGAAALPFPYDGIPTNVACSFCNTRGNHRGAIVFDGRGRATFYSQAGQTGAAVKLAGGSLVLYGTDLPSGASYSTAAIVVTAIGGTARTFHAG